MTNRLTRYFEETASPDKPAFAPKGFEAVSLAGIVDGNRLRATQPLYEFAYFLAQIREEGDPAALNRWLDERS